MKKHNRCALRGWCKKHGFNLGTGERPPLPARTRVAIILGIDHDYKTLSPTGHATMNVDNWRWDFSGFDASDIFAWKVDP